MTVIETAAPLPAPAGDAAGAGAADALAAESSAVRAAQAARRREAFAEAISRVVADDRELARVAARRAENIDAARRAGLATSPIDRSSGGPRWLDSAVARRELITELAAALRVSEWEARRLVDTSEALMAGRDDPGGGAILPGDVRALPATREALTSGSIGWKHAETIAQHAVSLPVEAVPDFEARLLPAAATLTVKQLERRARHAVEEVQPTTAIERHQAAADGRELYFESTANGMAYLTQYLPAVEGVAIWNRATEMARGLKNAGDPRTLTQLRVDVLSDLQLNGETTIPGATRGIRARVTLTVPALALLGQSDEPARLDGHGPIDPLTAGRLVATAPSLLRVLTDPMTGDILSRGRRRYRPGAELDDHVRLLYGECAMPPCSQAATYADIDHQIDFAAGGETKLGNLAPLCTSHHKVKHHTSWLITPAGEGGVEHWTSPAGFTYVIEPDTRMRPAPVRFREPPPF